MAGQLWLIGNHEQDHGDRTDQNGTQKRPDDHEIVPVVLFLFGVAHSSSHPLLCAPSHQGKRPERPQPHTRTVLVSSILTRYGRFPVSFPLWEPSQYGASSVKPQAQYIFSPGSSTITYGLFLSYMAIVL